MAMTSHCARPVSRPRRTPGRTPRQRTVLSEQVRSGGASGTAGARPDRSSASNARPASSEAGTPSTETAAGGRKRMATMLLPGGAPRPAGGSAARRSAGPSPPHTGIRPFRSGSCGVCKAPCQEKAAESAPMRPAPQAPETAAAPGSSVRQEAGHLPASRRGLRPSGLACSPLGLRLAGRRRVEERSDHRRQPLASVEHADV